jgi:hypothetical protein
MDGTLLVVILLALLIAVGAGNAVRKRRDPSR